MFLGASNEWVAACGVYGRSAGLRVLLAEDDVRLAAVVQQAMTESGWAVDPVHDGVAAYHRLLSAPTPDVAVLDWMLPAMDGVSVVRRVRGLGVAATPILMLTARGDVRDRVAGLDAGADDYLSKPFDLDELLARVRALHRRTVQDSSTPLYVGDLRIDPAARSVSRAGVDIVVSAREFDILHLLVSRAGEVVTRQRILDEVWDSDTDVRSNVIDVHLAAIRAKVDRPFGTATITTMRGVGYRVDRPDARQ